MYNYFFMRVSSLLTRFWCYLSVKFKREWSSRRRRYLLSYASDTIGTAWFPSIFRFLAEWVWESRCEGGVAAVAVVAAAAADRRRGGGAERDPIPPMAGDFVKIGIPQQKTVGSFLFPAVLAPNPSVELDLRRFTETVRDQKPRVEEMLRSTGAVLLRGFPVRTASDFNEAVEAFGYEELPYVGGAAPRTNVVGRVFTANESPPDQKIPFHHEMSQVSSTLSSADPENYSKVLGHNCRRVDDVFSSCRFRSFLRNCSSSARKSREVAGKPPSSSAIESMNAWERSTPTSSTDLRNMVWSTSECWGPKTILLPP